MSVLATTSIKRVFKFNHNGETIELEDFNPSLPFGEIVKFYASQYPELTTAKITGPKSEGDSLVFSIDTKVGTLG